VSVPLENRVDLRLNWLLLLYALLALAIGWAYASLRIQTDYDQTLDMERSRLRGSAAFLQTSLEAMMNDAVGAAVAGVNAVMTGAGDIDPATPDERSSALGKMLTGGDYVRSLFLYSPGHYARTGREGARETLSERPDWLTLPRSNLNGATWVGKPIPDPDRPGELVIPVARHIVTADRDGIWAGALFEFMAFDELYRQLGRDVRVMGLIAADGTVLAMLPKDAAPSLAPGASVADNELFRQSNRRPDGGVVEGISAAMGNEMLYGYERVHGFGMTIFVGQSRAAVLGPWRDRRRTTLMVTGAASALIIVITTLLSHSQAASRRRKDIEAAHTRRVERQTAALLHFASRHGAGGWHTVQQALREICEKACDVIEVNRVAAWKVMLDDTLHCVECFDRASRRHGEGFEVPSSRVARFLETVSGERVVAVADIREDPRMSELHACLVTTGTVGLIATVVRCSGRLAGIVLFEQAGTPRGWHSDECGFAGGVGDQIAQSYLDTERGQAMQELGRTAGELMRLQDEERRRIGRDLHDSTGQMLAALELSLSRLMQAQPDSLQRRELLEQCVLLANQCSAEIRTASYLLHPPLLDELGLVSAIRWLADGFRERSGMDVHLDLPTSMQRLPRDEELTLFRVAQEALTNVHRHAASPWVAIRLTEQDGLIVLEIEDGGVGISGQDEAHPVEFALGVGLTGMRERIRQVGGTLNVEAGRRGTIVRAAVPAAAPQMSQRKTA
jgi:signal transduction histidine kinase